MITYYFSKYRNKWVEFKNQPPSKGELLAIKKYKYRIKTWEVHNENNFIK